MGENAHRDVYVVGMHKVMTSHVAICMSHVSGLRMVVIYRHRTHFKIAITSVHSLLELITWIVCDWSEKLAKFFYGQLGLCTS